LLYTLPKQNAATLSIGRALHLPLARVYGYRVELSQFLSDLETLQYLESTDSAFSQAELKKRVWDHIREEYATRKLAKEQGITWSQAELTAYLDSFLSDNELSIRDMYASIPHFDKENFTEHTILPMLLRINLVKKMLLTMDSDTAREISAIHAELLKDPSQFQTILKKRAEDQSIPYADGLLLISVQEIDADEASLLRSVDTGSITPVIVRRDGYRVYQIVSHFTDPEEAWQVRELFIPSAPLDAVLAGMLHTLDERIYMHGIL
jgi:hypothetical protein